MYDSGKIITGLVIALILLTFPLWYNMGSASMPAPDPKLTPKAKAAGKCIMPKIEMKTGHMQLLDDWRNAVVRDGQRYYIPGETPEYVRPEMIAIEGARKAVANTIVEIPGVGPLRDRVDKDDQRLNTGAGQQFEMSLQNTCMDCHSNKKEFCDQCHDYANVSPFCWDCHVAPEEK